MAGGERSEHSGHKSGAARVSLPIVRGAVALDVAHPLGAVFGLLGRLVELAGGRVVGPAVAQRHS